MKLYWLIAFLCSSCTLRPTATVTDDTGRKTKLTLGGTFMAESDEVVAELEAPGYHLRYMAKREDSTRVPIAGFQALVSKWLAGFTAHSQDLRTVTDGRIALGAQAAEVQKAKIAAGTASEQISADLAKSLAP